MQADRNDSGQFLQGLSGNPSGRPVGARNKLGEAFVKALEADFAEHGPTTIETVRKKKPDQYLKVIASLLPKDVNLHVSSEELTEAEILDRIRALDATIGPYLALARAPGTGGTATAPNGNARGTRTPNRVH